MLRRFLEEFALFLIPFVLFVAYLAVTGRDPRSRRHWDGRSRRLVLAGLAIVVAGLVYEGLFSTRHAGGYVPSHMQDGHLVPGEFR